MPKFKEFSEKTWDTIKIQIDNALAEVPPPWYAAFDADGTLWDNDAGNKFFDYEIQNRLLDLPEKPWEHVYKIKDTKAELAFLWLAQIHKNKNIKDVRRWATECFLKDEKEYPYFNSIKELIGYLQFKGVEIVVVTASVKWAVEPVVKPLGISHENVLGVKTKILPDGTVTDIQEGPVTYRKGKVEALLEKTKNIKPILSAGNTTGDIELIEFASHVKIAVSSTTAEHKIYKSELELIEHANKNKWITHSFI